MAERGKMERTWEGGRGGSVYRYQILAAELGKELPKHPWLHIQHSRPGPEFLVSHRGQHRSFPNGSLVVLQHNVHCAGEREFLN